MILIGTTNLHRTRGRGQFHCPACQIERPYRLRARRPFLTVYFVPMAPIGDAHQFVVCEECSERFDPSVLDPISVHGKGVEREQFENEAMRASILVALEDGDVDEIRVPPLLLVGSQLAGFPIDREILGFHCSIARENRIPLMNYIPFISRRWDHEQKMEGLGAMFMAASYQGRLSERQTEIFSALHDLLELTDQNYQLAIENALQWQSPHSA